MSLDKISKSLNGKSDSVNKSMEKSTHSSKPSSLDVIRLRADQKGKALASSEKIDLRRGRAIDEDGKPLQKQVKLSDKPTLEKPGLYGGMWRSGDGAGTSDGSKSQYNEQMLDIMQNMVRMMQNMENKLDQANQEICDKEKKNQELTNRLKQALREKEDLANQLKEVRLGETSSLQKGESSSLLVNWEKLTSWTKYFYPHYFAQTPTGEAWFDKYADDWVLTKEGANYMMSDNATRFFKTAPGERWFERKGDQWIESLHGAEYMKNNATRFFETALGGRWFERKGEQWLESVDGAICMKNNATRFFETALGRRWFERKGVQWLESEDGRRYRRFHDSTEGVPELNVWYREKTGKPPLKWNWQAKSE